MALLDKQCAGLTDAKSKRFKQITGLIKIVDGRIDVLTVDERKELMEIIIDSQAAQDDIAEGT